MSNTEKIKRELFEKIERGELYMRPRWQFMLKGILAVTGIVTVAIALLYLLSFIIFALRQSGLYFVPTFGFRGILTFLFSSPWLLVFFAVIFVITLEVLVRKYSFGYQKPLLYTMLGIVAFSLLGTYALAQSGIHERLDRYAQKDELPVMGNMYRNYGMSKLSNVHAGFITETIEDGYVLENRHGEELLIHLTKNTRLPYGAQFREREHVIVLGKRNHDDVVAEGMRPFPEGMRPMWAEEENMRPMHPQVRGKMRSLK